jgi:peptidyl-prolyl cis-trans isomerase A (cyclophilin A)
MMVPGRMLSAMVSTTVLAFIAAVAVSALQSNAARRKTPRLRNPAALAQTAPALYRVKFDTTRAPFVVQVRRAWAPNGADRFYNLVRAGFYDDCAFFRVIPYFLVQFGIHGDPAVQKSWTTAAIKDDAARVSNTRGTVAFATVGKDMRTTELFINYRNNLALDSQGFAPFGEVVDGLSVVDSINAEYREMPDPQRIRLEGNAYLRTAFPRLTYVKTAVIE